MVGSLAASMVGWTAAMTDGTLAGGLAVTMVLKMVERLAALSAAWLAAKKAVHLVDL